MKKPIRKDQIAQIWAYAKLDDGREFIFEGKALSEEAYGSVTNYFDIPLDQLVSIGNEDIGDEANHYIVLEDSTEFLLNSLKKVRKFFDRLV